VGQLNAGLRREALGNSQGGQQKVTDLEEWVSSKDAWSRMVGIPPPAP
jgi:hypothetical protein